MEKKFVITITKTAVVPMYTMEEAEEVARIISLREGAETMAGNLLFVTTDVKELEHV